MEKQLPTKNKIVGTSLDNLKELIVLHAEKGTNVLLSGQRGTGKELFAKLYHEASGRREFMPVNCAGINGELLISDLFGHKKGAFTGAINDRSGLIKEYGENDVIFLDEIGDASQYFQAALLRVLETGDYKPHGTDKYEKIKPDDLRIIAATAKIENVREDIKDRFTVLYLPALTNRKTDIPDLIREFCKDFNIKYISQQILDIFETHTWPGNAREVKSLLNEAVILCEMRDGDTLRVNDFKTHGEIVDNSIKIEIEKLPSNTNPLPVKKFIIPFQSKSEPYISVEGEILRQELSSITSAIRTIGITIERLSGNELMEHSAKKINFENTTPKELEESFWDYHAKKGRGGTKVEELFQGKIPKSTAQRKLSQAKGRLNSKNQK